MGAFVPDGYVDTAGAIRIVIEARFPADRKAIDSVYAHATATGRIINQSYRERQLREKAEPILRSVLFKGLVAAVIFDEDGELAIPQALWATVEMDGALLSTKAPFRFPEIRLRSALIPTSASITMHPTAARGPRPDKLNAVIAAMRAHGDLQDLAGMKQEAMAATFDAARSTCVKARDIVLSESSVGTATNSDTGAK